MVRTVGRLRLGPLPVVAVLLSACGPGCTYQSLTIHSAADGDCLPQGQDGCDGVDNDCDDEVDEDCCAGSESRSCGSGVGACVAGVQTCSAGLWGACVGEVGPTTEDCQSLADYDCDGLAGCLDLDCAADQRCDEACSGTATLVGCNGLVAVDTRGAENGLSWYECVAWDESGGEQVLAIESTETQQVTVDIVESGGADLDLFVLEADCRQRACIAHGDVHLSFDALGGRTYYLVVDGFVGGQGTAGLSVNCRPLVESCANGVDDDLDGAVDCDDSACRGSDNPACAGGDCLVDGPISCGSTRYGGFIAGAGLSDNIDTYSCSGVPVGGMTNPETAWSFVSPITGQVDFELSRSPPGDDLRLFLLDGACAGGLCLDSDPDLISRAVTVNQTYLLVVDGGGPSCGEYSVSVRCPEDCANGLDDDLNGLSDCFDPDCAGRCTGEVCGNGWDDDGQNGADCADPLCAADPRCLPVDCPSPNAEPLGCGAVYAGNTTDAYRATSLSSVYPPCTSGVPLLGPESRLAFRAVGEGAVVVTVSPATFSIAVITGCSPSGCVKLGVGEVSFSAALGADYQLVVDGPAGVAGPFTLQVDCGFEDCGNQADDDDDGEIDCWDSDCASTVLCEAGTCAADVTLTCNSAPIEINHPPVAGRSNQITRYGMGTWCDNGPQLGPETIVRLTSDIPRSATLLVEGGATGWNSALWSYWLAGDCEAALCTMFGGTGASGLIGAGRDGYVVIDGPFGQEPLTLTLLCNDPSERCANGVDDDGDQLVDCADPECAAAHECLRPEFGCPGWWSSSDFGPMITCGERVRAYTAGQLATAALARYSCNPDVASGGPEVIYRFASPVAVNATARLHRIAGDELEIFVLPGSCRPEECVALSSSEASFTALADRIYYLVVDGRAGKVGAFELELECD